MTTDEHPQVDLAVIGGGINGLAIAREAASRGLSVTLIEREDLGAETSAWSSRMIHGGLRYLEYFEFALVRESLRDRESLLQTAPHLVQPMEVLIPVFRSATRGPLVIRAGLILYDILSLDKSLPRHRFIKRREIFRLLPGLAATNVRAGAIYYDGQVPLTERLCVELAVDAAELGATIRNGTAAKSFEYAPSNGEIEAVVVTGGGGPVKVSARAVVNASGPWVNEVVANIAPSKRLIGGTKGSHIVLGPFTGAPERTVHFETETGKPLLVIPWRGNYMVGSTDLLFEGDAASAQLSAEEEGLLIGQVNRLFPDARVVQSDVLLRISGVRPLPYAPGKRALAITRRHHIHRHSGRATNLYSIIGGKLTTARTLAQETVELVARHQGWKLGPRVTRRRRFPGFLAAADRDPLIGSISTAIGGDREVAERLVEVYGSRAGQLVDGRASEELRRLSPSFPVIVVEVANAIDREWASGLVDIVARRLVLWDTPDVRTLAYAIADHLVDGGRWTVEEATRHKFAFDRWLYDRAGVRTRPPAHETSSP